MPWRPSTATTPQVLALLTAVSDLIADGNVGGASSWWPRRGCSARSCEDRSKAAPGGPAGGSTAPWRGAEDARFLRHYRNRTEFESAVETLLSPGAPRWALHLLGAGGAGKTMLVRYLAGGRFAAERGLPEIPVARVDFDHLDPRYPEARPGEVLLALAGDLLGFGVTREVEEPLPALPGRGR